MLGCRKESFYKRMAKFQKGNPGGPGRKKGKKSYSDAVRQLLSGKRIKVEWTILDNKGREVIKRIELKSSQDMNYGIAAAQIMAALKGDTTAARELIDRAEGKAKQSVKVENSGPIQQIEIGGSVIDFY